MLLATTVWLKTTVILAVLGYVTAQTSPALEPYAFDRALTEMHGNIQLSNHNFYTTHPTWLTVWPYNPNDDFDFGIYFWPPKYCHAIYICPVKKFESGKTFNDFNCNDNYIKIYPHISKLFFKKSASTVATEHVHVENSIQFADNYDGTFSFKVLKQIPEAHEQWKAWKKDKSKTEELAFEMSTNQDLLIVTNSRMCQAVKPSSPHFHAIFDEVNVAANIVKNQWPTFLHRNLKDKVYTDALALTGGAKKTLDLLAYLKNPFRYKESLGKIQQKCSNYMKTSFAGNQKPVMEVSAFVSTASYDVFQPAQTATKDYVLRLEFSVKDCHWIRFWASPADVVFKEYPQKMKLEDTLDFFFSEGFYMPPDSVEALELPDSQMISNIQLSVIRDMDATGDDHELMEVAFGTEGNNYIYRAFFKSKAFAKKNLRLHLIRSPKCETNVITQNLISNAQTAPVINMRDVKSCVFSFLDDPPKA